MSDREVFEDLPPSGTGARGSERWDETLIECRRQVGLWVTLEYRKTAQLASVRAQFLRRRNNGPGRWSFSARTLMEDGVRRHIVLGRYQIDVEDAA